MATPFSASSALGKAITRGKTPKISQLLTVPLNFALDTEIDVSMNVLHGIRNGVGIDGIQSVFVDNSNNADEISLVTAEGVTYVCPPLCQAIFPYFFSGEILAFKALSNGGVLVTLAFLNTREQAQIWSAGAVITGNVNVSGSTVNVEPITGVYTDASVALTGGGASQQVIAANAARKLLAIRNPATPASQAIGAPEPVYINWGAAAAVNGLSSWELLPGESLPEFLVTSSQAVFAACATAGHQLVIKWA